jgi:hypothetical protein
MDQGPSAATPEHEPDPTDGPMSLTGLADDSPRRVVDRILGWIPRILASKPHVVLLLLLGVYLIVLPLFGVMVSQKSELIGGNYTNVTSDIGACIAAGGTLHIISQNRKRAKVDQQRDRVLMEIHSVLHNVHSDAATELGRVLPMPSKPMPPQQQQPPADPGQQ